VIYVLLSNGFEHPFFEFDAGGMIAAACDSCVLLSGGTVDEHSEEIRAIYEAKP
jgi:hypothetical protein